MKLKETMTPAKSAVMLSITALVLTVYVWFFLHAESQISIAILLVAAILAVILSRRFGATLLVEQSAARRPRLSRWLAVGCGLALIAAFYSSHFVLLMLCGVLLYSTACLGLTVQFGYSGVANFAGAAFFGIGSYATAVLASHTAIPHVLVIFISGVIAAVIGSLLLLPVLRTRGHYAALVTIAFGILFKTFLEVNDTLGGPQGLKIPGMKIFGWVLNDNIEIGDIEISFYLNYVLVSLVLCVIAFVLVRRLERSWVGLSMDVVRTDETAASTFGLHIVR